MREIGIFLGLCALYLGLVWMDSASNKALLPVGAAALVILLWQACAICHKTRRVRR